ncbi:hypothetical protein [Streptomyces bluensis]|uniref:hypothetical protein n=1 Tax=Streptomyces bluensis TaxID=33897 RepID=UPI00332DB595
MSRSAPVVPAALLAFALILSACTGGGAKGTSGSNGGYRDSFAVLRPSGRG